MKKYDEIINTDSFKLFESMFFDIYRLFESGANTDIVSSLKKSLLEIAGTEVVKALKFKRDLSHIEDYCEKFFECKEKGFSYELGCRYQKIKFESVDNIDAEIGYLTRLLSVYSSEFPIQIELIQQLIIDLEDFKQIFSEYLAD